MSRIKITLIESTRKYEWRKLHKLKVLRIQNETIEYECNKKREWKLLRRKVLLIMNEIINMESIKNQEWKVLKQNEQF